MTEFQNTYIADMLNENIKKLKDNKSVFSFKDNPDFNKYKSEIENDPAFTSEQTAAITSDYVYTLVKAGAGCGKTYSLIKRLKFLLNLGVNMESIMNLSFSNAAIENIKDRFSSARVSTIASLCHRLFFLNVSSEIAINFYRYTFYNALSCIPRNLAFYHDSIQKHNESLKDVSYREFKDVFYGLKNAYYHHLFGPFTKRSSIKDFNNLLAEIVYNHYDIVIALLKQIGQVDTSLMEIIMAHKLTYNLDDIRLPEDFKDLKVMTLDECQDTSAMELIIMLGLSKRLNAQLYLLGDINQALYEWRSASPELMVLLEDNTEIFKSFELNTNFRSKNAILKYANNILDHVEINDVKAGMKLSTPKDDNVSFDTFQKTVTFSQSLQNTDETSLDWMIDKLNNNEQVAILAHSHNNALQFLKELKNVYDVNNKKVVDLTNSAADTIDYISATIQAGQKDLAEFAMQPHDNVADDFFKTLFAIIDVRNVESCNFYATLNDYQHCIKALQSHLYNSVDFNFLLKQYKDNAFTLIQWVRGMIDLCIKSEIILNDNLQKKQDEKNKQHKNINLDNYDIIVSTIHSSKGLEFENCLILYDVANKFYKHGINQEQLRAYGVAITRAKNTEHIFVHNSDDRKAFNQKINMVDTDNMFSYDNKIDLADFVDSPVEITSVHDLSTDQLDSISFNENPLLYAYLTTMKQIMQNDMNKKS